MPAAGYMRPPQPQITSSFLSTAPTEANAQQHKPVTSSQAYGAYASSQLMAPASSRALTSDGPPIATSAYTSDPLLNPYSRAGGCWQSLVPACVPFQKLLRIEDVAFHKMDVLALCSWAPLGMFQLLTVTAIRVQGIGCVAVHMMWTHADGIHAGLVLIHPIDCRAPKHQLLLPHHHSTWSRSIQPRQHCSTTATGCGAQLRCTAVPSIRRGA